MIDFTTKIRLIEEARIAYPTFEREFREYLGTGNSFNGAYNFFSLEDINYHKSISVKVAELEAWNTLHGSRKDCSPIILSEHNILKELETIDDSIN